MHSDYLGSLRADMAKQFNSSCRLTIEQNKGRELRVVDCGTHTEYYIDAPIKYWCGRANTVRRCQQCLSFYYAGFIAGQSVGGAI